MRKIINLALCLLVLSTICGCAKKEEEPSVGGQIVNPIIKCESLEEVNKKAGVTIVSPGVMGKEDKSYTYINVDPIIGQYVFEVNGVEYTLRASKNIKEDISGLYVDGNEFEEGKDFVLISKEYKMDRFFVDGVQYVLTIKDNGEMSEDQFYTIIQEIEAIHGKDVLVGEYADATSQRATAIVLKEDDKYNITVHWSSSATEAMEWNMLASFDGEKLTYAGENITNYKTDDKGNQVIEETASNNLGYFEVKDNILYWKGAAMDYCRDCAFEKVK